MPRPAARGRDHRQAPGGSTVGMIDPSRNRRATSMNTRQQRPAASFLPDVSGAHGAAVVRRTIRCVACAMMLVFAGSAMARDDLPTRHDGLSGPPTRVMVLGTVHLGQDTPERVDASALEPVLGKLEAFGPDIITIEAMPGETCDLMARHPTIYDPDGVATCCPETAAARAATGLDVPAALAAVEQQLATWPSTPTPAQRRRLAATFLAAGEPGSALVQWLHLPEDERRAADGLDETLVEQLHRRAASANENTSIGAALAVRLGLQRLHPVDDHTGDNLRIDDMDGFANAIRGAWNSAPGECLAVRERLETLGAEPDLLALYRYTNHADYRRVPLTCDFGPAQRESSPQRFGRQYVAGWDVRNLRMVANIGAAFRERPGARVLSIVGASHKPWFDALLAQMQGVEVVDAGQVLE